MRRVILAAALCALACGQTDRDKASEILADKTAPTGDTLVRAAKEIWRDTPTIKHTISAEPRGTTWRLFVIVDRPDKPVIEDRGGTITITFHQYLDGKSVGQTMDMMGAAHHRNLHQVLIADRYRVDVLGRMTTIVAPSRAIVRDDGNQQMFDSWEPDDMARLQPYDLVMNKQGQLLPAAP